MKKNMTTTRDVQDAIALFLKKGGKVTVVKSAKARGVQPMQMKLTTNRSNRRCVSRTFSLGYSITNYDRFFDCRRACALGKIAVK